MPPKGSKAVRKSATAAAPAGATQSFSNTNFLDALMVVPDLAHACSHVLGHRMHGTGGGLKQLRSVSRGARVAAQAAVQGFTLKLGGKATPVSPELLTFLSKSQLRILRIKISALGAPAGGLTLSFGAERSARKLNMYAGRSGPCMVCSR